MTTYYLQEEKTYLGGDEYATRLLIAEAPIAHNVVKQTVEDVSWITAKERFGFELTPLQLLLKEEQKEARRAARRQH